MHIAITGGSGFIGTRLQGILAKDGHTIVNIDLREQTPVDICNREDLINAVSGCDIIYHLAAEHRDDVSPISKYYDVNGKGTKNLIDAAEINGIKHIIFTSSVAIYGLNAGTPDENAPANPFNDYGKSKLEAETHLKLWAEKGDGRCASIIRPVVVFGENNRGNVHTLIRQIISGKFIKIGNGNNKKSMAYVGNVAAFLKHLMKDRDGIHIYNYSDKPDLSVNELLNTVYTTIQKDKPSFALPYPIGLVAGYGFDALSFITRKKLPISSVRIQKFCADTTVNADKAHTQSGFQSHYTIEDGLKNFIQNDFLNTQNTQNKNDKAA